MYLKDALQRYVSSLRVRAKDSTVKQAEFHQSVLERLMPNKPVTSIRPSSIDAFIIARRAEGVGDASINGSLRILRATMRLFMEESGRRVTRVRMLKTTRKLPSVLTADEFRRLLNEAGHSRARLAILFAAKMGLRHQEILHLRWSDVDSREVRIVAKDGWSPKSHEERVVPMHPDVWPSVWAWGSHEKTPEDWIFEGQNGRPVKSLETQVRGVFEAAGLYDKKRKPGLHMLRRTWATNLLAHADIETVRQLGGWSNLEVVQRYVTSTDARKRAAIEQL